HALQEQERGGLPATAARGTSARPKARRRRKLRGQAARRSLGIGQPAARSAGPLDGPEPLLPLSGKGKLMRIPTTTRRNLLRAAGGAGLALPFGGLLRSQSVRGATGTAPKRFLVLDMPNAVWRADWLPTGGRNVDAGTGDATQFQYGVQSAFFEKI